MPPGQQVALEPALARCAPTGPPSPGRPGARWSSSVSGLAFHARSRHLEDGLEPVRRGLVGAEQPEVVGVHRRTRRAGTHPSTRVASLVVAPGRATSTAYARKSGRRRSRSSAAVRVRVRAHAPLALRRQSTRIASRAPVLVEQLLGAVRPHPRPRASRRCSSSSRGVGERHLMGRNVPSTGETVDAPSDRSIPSGCAARSSARRARRRRRRRRRPLLDRGDLVEARGRASPPCAWCTCAGSSPVDEIRVVAVAREQLSELVLGDARRAPWGWRSCSR